jgi:hypothetical protein
MTNCVDTCSKLVKPPFFVELTQGKNTNCVDTCSKLVKPPFFVELTQGKNMRNEVISWPDKPLTAPYFFFPGFLSEEAGGILYLLNQATDQPF